MFLYEKLIQSLRNLSKKLHNISLLVIIFATVLGFLTFFQFRKESVSGFNSSSSVFIIYLDFVCLLVFSGLAARHLVKLWVERKKKLTGAKLHLHFVGLFSFMAIIPTVIISLFSVVFLNIFVESWFGTPVRQTLDETQAIAEAYLDENQKAIRFDAYDIVQLLRPQIPVLVHTPDLLNDLLNDEAEKRGLSEILVFNGQKQVVGRSYFTFIFDIKSQISDEMAKKNLKNIYFLPESDRIRGVVEIDETTQTYLFIGKLIEPKVFHHIRQARTALNDYHLMASQHTELQVTFILLFGIIIFLLLLSSIWSALSLSNFLIRPIRQLIEGADAVSKGNLSIYLEEFPFKNELNDLIASFNRMTYQLQKQKRDLVLSERRAAWVDVARRIAHEIKNPLTPIQLSAERLKRRYLKEISTQPEIFQACINTIVRQVEHIGELVREFSDFARMPEPHFALANIAFLIQETVSFFRHTYTMINLSWDIPNQELLWHCDGHQIIQVLNNLLQNSINALIENDSKREKNIWILLSYTQDSFTLIIEDNGPGFVKEHRERLMEPYYTTREKGTGLGLAIVSKIIADHNGSIELEDRKGGGARVVLNFHKMTLKPTLG
jgi:two-component system nitrogen regulation sensor histidine kinase NtrY